MGQTSHPQPSQTPPGFARQNGCTVRRLRGGFFDEGNHGVLSLELCRQLPIHRIKHLRRLRAKQLVHLANESRVRFQFDTECARDELHPAQSVLVLCWCGTRHPDTRYCGGAPGVASGAATCPPSPDRQSGGTWSTGQRFPAGRILPPVLSSLSGQGIDQLKAALETCQSATMAA